MVSFLLNWRDIMKNKEVDQSVVSYLLLQLEPVEKACKLRRNLLAVSAVSCGAAAALSIAKAQIPVGTLFVNSAALSAALAIKTHVEYKNYKVSNDLLRDGKYEEFLEKHEETDNQIFRSACNLLSSELIKKEIKNSDIFSELAENKSVNTNIEEQQTQRSL